MADGEPRVALVLSDHLAAGKHEWPAGERGRIGAQSRANDLRVIAVGDEADVLALDLFGDDFEPERMRD